MRLWMVSTSLVLADMSMMSTSACSTICSMMSRNSARLRIAHLAAVRFGRAARRADGQGHVGVLGVGEDEVLAAVRIGVNARQLLIERFRGHSFDFYLFCQAVRGIARLWRQPRVVSVGLLRLQCELLLARWSRGAPGPIDAGRPFIRRQGQFDCCRTPPQPTTVGTDRQTSRMP